jgi:hypothetical protein
MRMIRAQALFHWRALKPYRELDPSEYLEWDYHSESVPPIPSLCVSHRWGSASHPDPKRTQLFELQQRLASLVQSGEQYVIFYDYCSMPQAPRSPAEEQIFSHDLASLNALFHQSSKVIILSEGYTDYKDRAWCFLELVLAGRKDKLHLFADQQFIKKDLDFAEAISPWWNNVIHTGLIHWVTDYHLKPTYLYVPGVVESLLGVLQHLDACRVTNLEDLVPIRRQMSAYLLGWGQAFPCGSLLIALSKYFHLTYCLIGGGTVFECKPYFEQPEWNRLLKGHIFSLPPPQFAQLKEIAKTGKVCPLIRLSLPGGQNIVDLFKRYEGMPDWEQYVVPPNKASLSPTLLNVEYLEGGAILIPANATQHQVFSGVDPFPSLAHVIHTVLDRTPGLFQLPGSDGRNDLFLILPTESGQPPDFQATAENWVERLAARVSERASRFETSP